MGVLVCPVWFFRVFFCDFSFCMWTKSFGLFHPSRIVEKLCSFPYYPRIFLGPFVYLPFGLWKFEFRNLPQRSRSVILDIIRIMFHRSICFLCCPAWRLSYLVLFLLKKADSDWLLEHEHGQTLKHIFFRVSSFHLQSDITNQSCVKSCAPVT